MFAFCVSDPVKPVNVIFEIQLATRYASTAKVMVTELVEQGFPVDWLTWPTLKRTGRMFRIFECSEVETRPALLPVKSGNWIKSATSFGFDVYVTEESNVVNSISIVGVTGFCSSFEFCTERDRKSERETESRGSESARARERERGERRERERERERERKGEKEGGWRVRRKLCVCMKTKSSGS